jgi:hypothetical protein
MNLAINILKIKREYYKLKRIKLLERKEELINEDKPLLATALEFAIDSVQEFISDLTEMINDIKKSKEYQIMCEELINNKLNK